MVEKGDGKMEVVMKRLICFLLLIGGLHAKYEKIRSASAFYKYLEPSVKDQLTLAAVLFYDKNEGKVPKGLGNEQRKLAQEHHREIAKNIKAQKRAFENTARAFKEVDLLSVDVGDKDNIQLRDAYQVAYYPTLRLFRKGEPVIVDGKNVELKGDFNQGMIFEEPAISQFVRAHFGEDIDTIIKAKAKAQWELEKRRASAPKYYNYGPYWGWGWGGYGGWGWGGYGGWGWGGGCCW